MASRRRSFHVTKASVLLFLTASVLLPPAPASDAAGPPRDATFDDLLAFVGTLVPSFAGFYFTEGAATTLNVLVTDQSPASAAAARRALQSALGETLPSNVETLPAAYPFVQLKTWYDQLRAEVWSIQGVTLTDIDEMHNKIIVGVQDASRQGPEVRAEATREGIPADALDVTQHDGFTPLSSLQDRHRPLVGGLQIEEGTSSIQCTLGFIAQKFIGANLISGFVTNAHCTPTLGAVDSPDGFWQPFVNFPPTNIVGSELEDPPLFTGGACPPGRRCRYSDAAFISRDSLSNPPTIDLGGIARPAAGQLAWDGKDKFRITDDGMARLNVTVVRVGRTTGRRSQTVANTCTDLRVLDPFGNDTGITMLCQELAITSVSVQPGDSGAPIFRITNSPKSNDVRLSGIVWGGSQADVAFSSIRNMQRADELGGLLDCDAAFPC